MGHGGPPYSTKPLSRGAGEGLLALSGLHRAGALELGAVHQAAGRGIEGVAAVHRAAIVPPDEVARLPILPPGEFLLGRVLPQEIEELLAFPNRQAENVGVDAAAAEKRLAGR